MAGGRPTKYEGQETLNKIIEYLDGCEPSYEEVPVQTIKKNRGGLDIEEAKTTKYRLVPNLPTIEGVCLCLDIRKSTLYEWEKEYPEFSNHINMVREKQAEKLQQYGITGEYNPVITKVLLSQHGYRDTVVNENKNTNENITPDQANILDDISE